MLLIPGALIALITLHLYLVIRLGITSPPWTKDAGGAEPTRTSPAGAGSSSRRPRGDGAGATEGRPEGDA